jgi:hypothetical protein
LHEHWDPSTAPHFMQDESASKARPAGMQACRI